MEFRSDKAIYLQIADYLYDKILTKEWKAGDRVPSVREIGALLEVNPNTAMRTYTALQEAEIITNKRGIGYFLSDDCYKKAFEIRRQEFVTQVLPSVFSTMQSLGITPSDLTELFNQHLNNQSK